MVRKPPLSVKDKAIEKIIQRERQCSRKDSLLEHCDDPYAWSFENFARMTGNFFRMELESGFCLYRCMAQAEFNVYGFKLDSARKRSRQEPVKEYRCEGFFEVLKREVSCVLSSPGEANYCQRCFLLLPVRSGGHRAQKKLDILARSASHIYVNVEQEKDGKQGDQNSQQGTQEDQSNQDGDIKVSKIYKFRQFNWDAVEIAKVFHNFIMVCEFNSAVFVCTKVYDYTGVYATYVPIAVLVCKQWHNVEVLKHFFKEIRQVCNMECISEVVVMNPSNSNLKKACQIFSDMVIPGFWEVLVELRNRFPKYDKVKFVKQAWKLRKHFVELENSRKPYDVDSEVMTAIKYKNCDTANFKSLVSMLNIWRNSIPEGLHKKHSVLGLLFTEEDIVCTLEFTSYITLARLVSYFHVLSSATARYVRNLRPYDFKILE